MSQRTLPTLLAASVLAVAAGALGGMLASDRSAPPSGVAASNAVDERAAIESLVQRQTELERSIADLRTKLAMAPAADTRSSVSEGEVAAAVEAWMRKNAPNGDGLAAATREVDPTSAARAREATITDAIDRLTDPNLKDSERQQIWKDLAASGLADLVLSEFESRAELDPNNADKRVDLAQAYLQKLFTLPQGPEQGTFATKADKAYDAALAIDSNHWSARFGKAVSLSFWPPVFGKQREAISNFEMLIAQQANLPRSDNHAQTHLLLGNMYSQSGDKAKAVAAWQAGLTLYPDNEALKKQLELSQGD